MSIQWRRIVQSADGPGWIQYADVDLADAWAARAAALCAPDAIARLDSRPWGEQRAAVASAFEAAGNAYRAINLPPYSDPRFRARFEAWYGDVAATSADDATAHRIRALRIAAQGRSGIIVQRIRDAWATAGLDAIDGGHLLCGVVVRINLTESGLVERHCFEGLGSDDAECNFEQRFGVNIYCTANGGPIDRSWPSRACDPYSWRTLAMDGSASAGSALPCTISRALPPLRWSLEFLAEAIGDFVARGARRVIEDGRLSVVARNAVELDRLGLLAGESEELRTASHALASTVAAYAVDNPNKRQIAGTIAALAAIAQAIPVVGTAASAILGVAGAFVTLSPWAVGIEADSLGRGRPFYEVGFIDPNTPPHFDVPDPPGFARGEYRAAPRTASQSYYTPLGSPLFFPIDNHAHGSGAGGSFGGGGASGTYDILPHDGASSPLVPLSPMPPPTATAGGPPAEPEKAKSYSDAMAVGGVLTALAVVPAVFELGAWVAKRMTKKSRRR